MVKGRDPAVRLMVSRKTVTRGMGMIGRNNTSGSYYVAITTCDFVTESSVKVRIVVIEKDGKRHTLKRMNVSSLRNCGHVLLYNATVLYVVFT